MMTCFDCMHGPSSKPASRLEANYNPLAPNDLLHLLPLADINHLNLLPVTLPSAETEVEGKQRHPAEFQPKHARGAHDYHH